MKYSTLNLALICTFLFGFTSSLFGQTLYGLKKPINGSMSIPFDVVNIDPFTGSSTVQTSTNSLLSVAVGATAYDQQNSRIICWGFDSTGSQLFVVNIDSSTVASSPFSATQAIEMEYDLQTQKTYGLWWDGSAEHFGEIDLTTGMATSTTIIQGVNSVAIGNSTFDSNTGTYIFVGVDTSGYRLYSVAASTGGIISSPSIWQDNHYYMALEFNNNNNKLYGLYTDVDSSNFNGAIVSYYKDLRLAEIDFNTGNYTVIDTLSAVASGYYASYQIGGLCFDQQSETYIVKVLSDSGAFLQMVDVATANVTSSVPLADTNIFYELQVDNYPFARSFYDLSLSLERHQNNLLNLLVYPNPATEILTLETESKLEDIIIYNINGQIVKQMTNLKSNQIQVNELPSGTYFIIVKTDEGLLRKEFVKL